MKDWTPNKGPFFATMDFQKEVTEVGHKLIFVGRELTDFPYYAENLDFLEPLINQLDDAIFELRSFKFLDKIARSQE